MYGQADPTTIPFKSRAMLVPMKMMPARKTSAKIRVRHGLDPYLISREPLKLVKFLELLNLVKLLKLWKL
jgi:hypothetical protein